MTEAGELFPFEKLDQMDSLGIETLLSLGKYQGNYTTGWWFQPI